MSRIVFDTSTLVSAALRVDSIPHMAMLDAFGTCEVCASAETLNELDAVLCRAKFAAYLDHEARRKFVSLVRRHIKIFAIQEEDMRALGRACRDPADDKFLALALAAEAEILVSSDEDLLVLHPWCGIDIMVPREFLNRSRLSAATKNDSDT